FQPVDLASRLAELAAEFVAVFLNTLLDLVEHLRRQLGQKLEKAQLVEAGLPVVARDQKVELAQREEHVVDALAYGVPILDADHDAHQRRLDLFGTVSDGVEAVEKTAAARFERAEGLTDALEEGGEARGLLAVNALKVGLKFREHLVQRFLAPRDLVG